MKYIAKPVVVVAYKILTVGPVQYKGVRVLKLDMEYDPNVDDLGFRNATHQMCSRMEPAPGDYWVIQSDGYEYLNPKDVFERKYEPLVEREEITA